MERVAPEAVGLSSTGLDAVDAAVRAKVEDGTIAGAVTLVARRGKIARLSIMGVDDRATGTPLAEDTIFRIFSMTKPITGTAMMILHDEGRWHPDDPIAKHLPEFAGVTVYGGEAPDGTPILIEPDHPPTMAELMTHRAGFAYGIAIGPASDRVEEMYREVGVLGADDLGDMIARLGTLPLAYQPGSRWRYSLAMDVQGAIVERLSGQTLPVFMEQRIFAPLGMTDTAFHVPPGKRNRLAKLYLKTGDAPLTAIANPLRPEPDAVPAMAMGGGGLFSTVIDYARYAQMLLDGGVLDGRRIVSAEGVRAQMTNRLPDAMLERGFVAGHHRFRPGFGYGYNGVVVTDPVLADLPVGVGSYFWDGAAGTWFWVDPVHDLLFVGMIQLLSYTAPPLQETTQRLIAAAIRRDQVLGAS
ncbi:MULTISPECIES: serine hydrolase domain-containing protein [unclassified Sphingomonas]|uniref:serine hydrolase domain-containing protein n=1 Tax=unclassified Sphingomonas TaxID=196159 RepID=UPI00226A9940|nr:MULTISPECIES: serine hydrolase domain-containing protein [unclassified Sphingomonas]